MKISLFTSTPNFKSVREDRNTVSQLRQNNNYSLTEPNQRKIGAAIDNLAQEGGETNVEFLLDVGKNLAYQTRIPSDMSPKNDWRSKLKSATEQSLSHSDPILRNKYDAKITSVFSDKKGLNPTERAILQHRDSILSRCDLDSLNDNPNKNIRNLERNMNYFVISSETPTKQKLEILKKLDYFMSDKYEINPQLTDKKTQVLAEMINDMAINSPDAEIPNIKAINQKSHGMCAAISIARKAMAYEDKLNYVDAIMSELDATDKVMIYDRQNLGSGKRVPVRKIPIDFNYAQEKGYRIIDASTLQWMNIAKMFGSQNEPLENFFAFDKENFDAFHDSFFLKPIDNENLQTKQSYYQSLMKAKDVIGGVKSRVIKNGLDDEDKRLNRGDNIKLINEYTQLLQNYVGSFMPGLDKKEQKSVVSNILSLQKNSSEELDKLPEEVRMYSFMPNEEQSQKELKVKYYLVKNYPDSFKDPKFDKVAEDVVSIIDNINTLSDGLDKKTSLSKKIGYARQLYNAEASYTASILTGLSDPDILNDRMIEYNIPDAQTRLLNGFDSVIDRIANNDDKILENHFRDVFQFEEGEGTKEDIINNLQLLRQQSEQIYTIGLDNLFGVLGLGNRRILLNNEIESSKQSVKSGDKNEIARAAKCMKVSADKNTIIKKYDAIQNSLINTDDESAYFTALNAMGYKNPLDMFVEIYQTYQEHLLDGSSHTQAMLANFIAANELQDGNVEQVQKKLVEIGQVANLYVNNIELAEDMLEVRNSDNSIYHTILPANMILKKMESEGRILPEKDMKRLQERFVAIDKIKSQDEFARRSGKISKPELYQLSPQEKIALKKIDSNLNKMYADVVRSFNKQYREIKPDLAKLARYVGTNSGSYWVCREGSSGLLSDNEAKIFEQLTDRPYYLEEDIEKGVEAIKDGTHSGISSSSVFHNEMGMHAQYIADIDKGPNGKDILYHDNTWGASEHENTWVDSEGLTRTDYSDVRGGELGYVTNDAYRNGNYVENIVNKTGHVSRQRVDNRVYNRINPGGSSEFDFALMTDMILPGMNPEYKDIAGSFKDSFFIPDSAQVGSFNKIVKKMTKEEIRKAMFRVDTAGRAYHTKFDKLEKRVKPTHFNKGITTQAEYDALPDSDFIKLTFEKAAVRMAYPDASMYKYLPAVKSMEDIKSIRDQQREKAREYFEYSFGKAPEATTCVAFENGHELYDVLEKAFKDNKVKVKNNQYADIMTGFVAYDKGEEDLFTGRVSDNITFSVNKLLKQIDSTLPSSENVDAAKEQIRENMTNFLSDAWYFNEEDLKQTSPKAIAIRRWIDDKYNPQSDKEFVQIYRRLQDMTVDEFRQETKDVSDATLCIKNITGFDVLKKFNISNEAAENMVRNVLYYDEFSSNFNLSKTKPAYKYRKLEKVKSGAYYEGARTFDDLYSSMKYSLMTLDYEKMFNKYADRNFRNYNAIPAYPKVDLKKDPILDEKKRDIVDLFENSTGVITSVKNTITGINLVHGLDEYRQLIPSGRTLTDNERLTINDMIGTFITANNGDQELQRSTEAAMRLIELDENATIDDYNADIDVIVNEFKGIEQLNSIETLYENLNEHEQGLQHYFNVVMNTNIPKKYHKEMHEDAKNWLNAEKHSYNHNNPYAFQQRIIELRGKVSEAFNGIDNKSFIEDFTVLTSAVASVRAMNSMKNVSDEVKAESLNTVENSIDEFVNKHIVPEKQANIRANIERYVSKEMHDSASSIDYLSELDKARDKFMKDYTNYHLANQPGEVLEGYLMENAKDADKLDNMANIYTKYLEKHLDLAKLVEIQDNLMEAVSSGNAAEVRDYFDDYNVDFGYGDVSMASDAALDYMIRSILIENNTKTAKMFVEKLGLGDRVMKLEKDILDSIDQKAPVDDIVKLITDTNVVVEVVNKEGSKLYNTIDSAKNPAKEVEKMINTVVKKTEKLEDKSVVEAVLNALDALKSVVSSNTGLLPSVFTANYITELLDKISQTTNEKIEAKQLELRSIELIYSYLLDLNLPEYSEGHKLQQELQKSYDKHNEYYGKAMVKLSSSNGYVSVAPLQVY